MALIQKPVTFAAGAAILASEHNSNFDIIYNDYNGNVDNDNIVATAGIAGSKIDPAFVSSGNDDVVTIDNNGTGQGLVVQQDGVLAASKYALYVESDAAQVNASLIFFQQDNVSSTKNLLDLKNDGTGDCIQIQQQGNGQGIELNNNNVDNGMVIIQDGIQAANRYALYVESDAAQVNSPLVLFEQDSASSDQPTLQLKQDGTAATFTDYVATSAASVTNPLTSWTVGVNMQGMMRVGINGTDRWIPFYDAPSS